LDVKQEAFMAISITKPTTTFVLVHSFKIDYKEGTQRLNFTADLGEGEKDCYDAIAKVKEDYRWIEKDEDGKVVRNDLSAKDGTHSVLSKATLEEIDGKWHFTSLVRDEDSFEVVHKKLNLLALAIANRKAGK
jgi:hypothetical protein